MIEVKELTTKIAKLESITEVQNQNLDNLRQQLNHTNTMLIQIKEGILGNEFSKGLKTEIQEVKLEVKELEARSLTIGETNEIKKDIESLKTFKSSYEKTIAKGLGIIAGVSFIFSLASDFLISLFKK